MKFWEISTCSKWQVPKIKCRKRNTKLQQKYDINSFLYIVNPGTFGTQTSSVAYSEPWNIQKFDGIYIPVKQIVMSFRNSSGP